MRAVLWFLVAGAVGYAIGSIPFGLWMTRRSRGVDVREIGSGGTGATNVLRAAGPVAAGVVFSLDVAKGAVAAALGGAISTGGAWLPAAGALAAVVGHMWPVWARFRGGKGVATAFGGLLVLSFPLAMGTLFVGACALVATRVASVASLATVVVGAAGGIFAATQGNQWSLTVFCVGAAPLILYRHVHNVRRLLHGTEPKLGAVPIPAGPLTSKSDR